MKLLSLTLILLGFTAPVGMADDGLEYMNRPRVVDERAIWPQEMDVADKLAMPQFVQDKMDPITIGIITEHQFAGCLSADDATEVGKLHVEAGYPTAVQQFGRLAEENHCNVIAGRWFPHRVVWHGDLKESTLKVVEMSPVGPDNKPDFKLKFYILTEREVVGSGIKDKVAGTQI